jgi:hypothetical protein
MGDIEAAAAENWAGQAEDPAEYSLSLAAVEAGIEPGVAERYSLMYAFAGAERMGHDPVEAASWFLNGMLIGMRLARQAQGATA